MTHTCPGPRCQAQIDHDQLACSRHWYQVPHAIRSAVWRAWKNGAGAGTTEHRQAIRAAIRTMTPLRRK